MTDIQAPLPILSSLLPAPKTPPQSSLSIPLPLLNPIPPTQIPSHAHQTPHRRASRNRQETRSPDPRSQRPYHGAPQTPVVDLHLALVLQQPPAPVRPLNVLAAAHARCERDGCEGRSDDATAAGGAEDHCGKRLSARAGRFREVVAGRADERADDAAALEAAGQDVGGEDREGEGLVFSVGSVRPEAGHSGGKK